MTVLKTNTINNVNLNEIKATFNISRGFTLTCFLEFTKMLKLIILLEETCTFTVV